MRPRWLPFVLAIAAIGAVGGCGDDDRLSREEFSQRLQSIIEKPSSAFGRVAQHGADLKPADVLPDELKRELSVFVETMREATDELEELSPPEDAEESTDELIAAIQERADALDETAREENITLREFAPTLTGTGERVDRALEALRRAGYLPESEEGD